MSYLNCAVCAFGRTNLLTINEHRDYCSDWVPERSREEILSALHVECQGEKGLTDFLDAWPTDPIVALATACHLWADVFTAARHQWTSAKAALRYRRIDVLFKDLTWHEGQRVDAAMEHYYEWRTWAHKHDPAAFSEDHFWDRGPRSNVKNPPRPPLQMRLV